MPFPADQSFWRNLFGGTGCTNFRPSPVGRSFSLSRSGGQRSKNSMPIHAGRNSMPTRVGQNCQRNQPGCSEQNYLEYNKGLHV